MLVTQIQSHISVRSRSHSADVSEIQYGFTGFGALVTKRTLSIYSFQRGFLSLIISLSNTLKAFKHL